MIRAEVLHPPSHKYTFLRILFLPSEEQKEVSDYSSVPDVSLAKSFSQVQLLQNNQFIPLEYFEVACLVTHQYQTSELRHEITTPLHHIFHTCDDGPSHMLSKTNLNSMLTVITGNKLCLENSTMLSNFTSYANICRIISL